VIAALALTLTLLSAQTRHDVPARLRTADRATAFDKAQAAPSASRGALLNGAAAALAAGQREEAKRLLRTAADRFQSVQALLQLSRLQSGDGDAAGALESLRKARTLAPNAEDVLSAFAQVSLAARMPVAAIVTLESLTRLCPTVAQYHYLLGVALMSAGDSLASIDALKKADALDADRPLTLIALGLAFNNQKLYGDARQALARAVELDADNVEAIAALAEAEAGLGEFAPAETHAARVLAKAPAHATANLVIGLVRMAQQRYPEARDAFITAATVEPKSPKPEYQLSLVYARLGDTASAERHVERYRQKLRDMEATVKALHDTGFGAVVK
jgi:tetratricopeptide (TPR) repeat protein